MKSDALLLAALFAAACSATDILVIGDTWAHNSQAEFQQMLKTHGSNMTVSFLTEAGSSALTWSTPEKQKLITSTVANCTGLRAIWMSIGAVGTYQAWQNCTQFPTDPLMCAAGNGGIGQAVLTMMYAVWAARYPMPIVGTGYDLTASENCPIPKELIPSCVGNTTCYNFWQMWTLQEIFESLRIQDDGVVSLNLYGTIQKAAGYPNVDIGKPDLSRFSPSEYFTDNCWVPNSKGFTAFLEQMWQQYFGKM
ncbi:hypothetical protein DIPPA_13395 [Diplonema papillatum]|nr:hypothetical protein DIPPA_13395 [Diplonema papillatum]